LKSWEEFFSKNYNKTKQESHNSLKEDLKILKQNLKTGSRTFTKTQKILEEFKVSFFSCSLRISENVHKESVLRHHSAGMEEEERTGL
jgi:hypothetical protein